MVRFLIYSLLLTLLLIAAPALAGDTLVVLNKEGASAWLLEPSSGSVRARIEVGEGPHEAAVSPDGRWAVVANYGKSADGSTLSVIDVAEGRLEKTIDLSPHRRPHGVVYLPDGEHVLVTSERRNALVQVHVATGQIVAELEAGADAHMIAFDEESHLIYATAIQFGQLCAIPLSGDGARRILDTGAGTEALALRPRSHEVWVGSNWNHELRVIDPRSWEVVATMACGLQPIRVAFTPDGRYALATGLLSGDLAVIDADSRSIDRRIGLGEFVLTEEDWEGKSQEALRAFAPRIMADGARPIGVLVGPDGRFVYVANRGQANVAVIDTKSWEIVRRLPTGPGPDGMAYSRLDSGS